MDRNYLAGRNGDANNAVLAAVGYNFRRLIRWLTLYILPRPGRDKAAAKISGGMKVNSSRTTRPIAKSLAMPRANLDGHATSKPRCCLWRYADFSPCHFESSPEPPVRSGVRSPTMAPNVVPLLDGHDVQIESKMQRCDCQQKRGRGNFEEPVEQDLRVRQFGRGLGRTGGNVHISAATFQAPDYRSEAICLPHAGPNPGGYLNSNNHYRT
jgi:hypothetical protein